MAKNFFKSSISSPKFSEDFFIVISSIFYISTIQNAAGTTAQAISSDLCFIHSTFSLNFPVFTPLFHSRTSKSTTTTTAQLPFYNCELHFTTAEIVISCTLKYALYQVLCLPLICNLFISLIFTQKFFKLKLICLHCPYAPLGMSQPNA